MTENYFGASKGLLLMDWQRLWMKNARDESLYLLEDVWKRFGKKGLQNKGLELHLKKNMKNSHS